MTSSAAPPIPIPGRASVSARIGILARVGWAMMFHGRAKLVGTLLGVVFATVLANQQVGTCLGLVYKNVMLPRNAGADIWITAPGTATVEGGHYVSEATLMASRTVAGVAWAEPLLYATVGIAKPGGGSEPMTLVGTRAPRFAGGPWNLVVGDREALLQPDTILVEDSDREKFGGLNVGSVREVAGRNVRIGGFTWGLEPFGPSFAFAEYDLARDLTKTPRDRTNFVLVGVEPGQDPVRVAAALRERVPEAEVKTRAEFEVAIRHRLLFESAIGITFGTSTLFGVIVGFVIVALSMFSAVVDNVREFGTLKALGTTTTDLALLLVVQAVTYALVGSLVGLFLVGRMAAGIRSAKLALVLPPELTGITVVAMVVMCVVASGLALLRIRNVEPAMVFR